MKIITSVKFNNDKAYVVDNLQEMRYYRIGNTTIYGTDGIRYKCYKLDYYDSRWKAFGGSKDVPVMKIDKESRKFVFSTDRLNELEAEKRKILDPIACLEVEGGYIILTAWDEEANIPEIRNTFLN